LKRLYDNYNIYACFVTLYDREDWELGLSESDTIQLALPADESDVNLIFYVVFFLIKLFIFRFED